MNPDFTSNPNKNTRIALFGYDFPHVDTCEMLMVLKILGYDVRCLLAAPWRKLKIKRSQIRMKPKRSLIFHPKDVADLMQVSYYSVEHNSSMLRDIVKNEDVNLGIIAGARILKSETIRAFEKGIINFHPGLIPENRGLDAVKWAIIRDIPQGVTAHFIDWRVDAGRIIKIKKIPVYSDDNLIDIQQRLYDTTLQMIEPTLIEVGDKTYADFELVKTDIKAHSTMPPEIEAELPHRYDTYRDKWGI